MKKKLVEMEYKGLWTLVYVQGTVLRAVYNANPLFTE